MKIVFVSNYFNHHQKPVSDNLYKQLKGEYSFVETEKMDEDRINLGWAGINKPQYVFSFNNDKAKCKQLIREADVIITGSANEKYLLLSHFKRKIILRYSERPFKKRRYPVFFYIKFYLLELLKILGLSKNYMLCSSGYTALDYKKIGLYRNRLFRWGYFPQCNKYNIDELLLSKNRKRIIWCARMLDWKHPEIAIELAKYLKDNDIDFELCMIGVGPLEYDIKHLIIKNEISDKVRLLGSMTPDMVRTEMEKAGIFVFTSDRYEGWGVVLNEAMNSGCTTVTCQDIGSVPYLIKDGVNGYTYPYKEKSVLFERVKEVLEAPEIQYTIGKKAYETIQEEWNAEVATSNLIKLINGLLNQCDFAISPNGPCSPESI